MQNDSDDLALLDFGKAELKQPLASIYVILSTSSHQLAPQLVYEHMKKGHLATHECHEHSSPHISVHALSFSQSQ